MNSLVSCSPTPRTATPSSTRPTTPSTSRYRLRRRDAPPHHVVPGTKFNNPALLSLITPPKPSPKGTSLSAPPSPTPGAQGLLSGLPSSLAPSPIPADSRNASPSRSPMSPHEPPPLYTQFTDHGSLDVPGTLLVIARCFEKLEKWTVGHVRALEGRMSDDERWPVEKENEKGGDRGEDTTEVTRGLSTKCETNLWRCKAVSASWDAKWPSSRPHPICYSPCHRVFQPKPRPPPLRPIHSLRSTHRRAFNNRPLPFSPTKYTTGFYFPHLFLRRPPPTRIGQSTIYSSLCYPRRTITITSAVPTGRLRISTRLRGSRPKRTLPPLNHHQQRATLDPLHLPA
jgi:hypothetical protein